MGVSEEPHCPSRLEVDSMMRGLGVGICMQWYNRVELAWRVACMAWLWQMQSVVEVEAEAVVC